MTTWNANGTACNPLVMAGSHLEDGSQHGHGAAEGAVQGPRGGGRIGCHVSGVSQRLQRRRELGGLEGQVQAGHQRRQQPLHALLCRSHPRGHVSSAVSEQSDSLL